MELIRHAHDTSFNHILCLAFTAEINVSPGITWLTQLLNCATARHPRVRKPVNAGLGVGLRMQDTTHAYMEDNNCTSARSRVLIPQ